MEVRLADYCLIISLATGGWGLREGYPRGIKRDIRPVSISLTHGLLGRDGLRRALIRSMDGCCRCRILFFVVDLFFAPAHSNVDNPGRGGDSVHASVMLDGRWAHRMLCSNVTLLHTDGTTSVCIELYSRRIPSSTSAITYCNY
ncbi:hypothetical protein EDB82DRAFT_230303 [Fusarium venenatum]|uniref:uncharacterized protein n=1 Tax=Fusarium venenatum TaxID=56646 RepID=UPI001DDCAF95|nr:hypothetical protein EDB82DRAFT_230303 [Fusarium venenatum]